MKAWGVGEKGTGWTEEWGAKMVESGKGWCRKRERGRMRVWMKDGGGGERGDRASLLNS